MTDRADQEKLETAACIAAVYAFIAAEEEKHKFAAQEKTHDKSTPAWGQASLLEQSSRVRISSSSDLKKLLTAITLVVSSVLPVQALERIEVDQNIYPTLQSAPADIGRNRRVVEDEASCPADLVRAEQLPSASEQLPPPTPKVKISVALGAATNSHQLALPDGAQLLDQFTGEVVAELPPSSLWNIRTENQKLVFEGQLTNLAYSQVVLFGSGTEQTPYRQAAFVQAANRTNQPKRTVLQSASPRFSLPAVRFPQRPETPLREVAFVQPVTKPAANQPLLPNAVKPKAEPLITFLPGYSFRPLTHDGIVSLGNRAYRGELALKPAANGSKMLPVNVVDVEDYLLSVVPSEMPSTWPSEALKAQSIAARTYAFANLGKHGKEGYDVKATVEDQVYMGIQSETQATNRAVFETQGIVLKHNGKPITAFFHSSGGGCTETSEHVFSRALPFLKSVEDPDHQSPHAFWTRCLPTAAIEEALIKQGKDIGKILAIFPVTRTPSQRLKEVLLSGTQSTLVVSGEELRRIFTLPSTLFNVVQSDDAYTLEGKGYGHGLGMSQWGAKFLAEQGYNADQILSYYYKDVTLDPIVQAQ